MALGTNCLVVQRLGHGSYNDVDLGLIWSGKEPRSCKLRGTVSKTKKEEKDVAYAYNGMLFSQEKEGNSAICNNSDGP